MRKTFLFLWFSVIIRYSYKDKILSRRDENDKGVFPGHEFLPHTWNYGLSRYEKSYKNINY